MEMTYIVITAYQFISPSVISFNNRDSALNMADKNAQKGFGVAVYEIDRFGLRFSIFEATPSRSK